MSYIRSLGRDTADHVGHTVLEAFHELHDNVEDLHTGILYLLDEIDEEKSIRKIKQLAQYIRDLLDPEDFGPEEEEDSLIASWDNEEEAEDWSDSDDDWGLR